MEAIYEFDVVDMPVTVAVDTAGTSVNNLARQSGKSGLQRVAFNTETI